MKGYLLAAGVGSRLRPLTDTVPKPMLPIGGVPLLELQLRWLKRFGITECAINLYHLPEAITDHLGDGSAFGMKLTYIREGELSGTAGPLRKLPGYWNEPFVTIYGDDLTTIDLDNLRRRHDEVGGIATVALYQEKHIESKGMVVLDDQGKIVRFKEKPKTEEVVSDLANAGIYICDPAILEWVPEGFADFGHDIFPALLAAGKSLYGYVMTEYLLDIGTPETYAQAQKDIVALAPQFVW